MNRKGGKTTRRPPFTTHAARIENPPPRIRVAVGAGSEELSVRDRTKSEFDCGRPRSRIFTFID